jgi:hypothetical protein
MKQTADLRIALPLHTRHGLCLSNSPPCVAYSAMSEQPHRRSPNVPFNADRACNFAFRVNPGNIFRFSNEFKYIRVVFDKPDCHQSARCNLEPYRSSRPSKNPLRSDDRDTSRPELGSNSTYRLSVLTDGTLESLQFDCITIYGIFGYSDQLTGPHYHLGAVEYQLFLSQSPSRNQILVGHISCRE